jgi:hypothetical protein
LVLVEDAAKPVPPEDGELYEWLGSVSVSVPKMVSPYATC